MGNCVDLIGGQENVRLHPVQVGEHGGPGGGGDLVAKAVIILSNIVQIESKFLCNTLNIVAIQKCLAFCSRSSSSCSRGILVLSRTYGAPCTFRRWRHGSFVKIWCASDTVLHYVHVY
jgi:hypothetical protein